MDGGRGGVVEHVQERYNHPLPVDDTFLPVPAEANVGAPRIHRKKAVDVALKREIFVHREVRLLMECVVLLQEGVKALVVLLDLALENLRRSEEGGVAEGIVGEGAGCEKYWGLVNPREQLGEGVEQDSI